MATSVAVVVAELEELYATAFAGESLTHLLSWGVLALVTKHDRVLHPSSVTDDGGGTRDPATLFVDALDNLNWLIFEVDTGDPTFSLFFVR